MKKLLLFLLNLTWCLPQNIVGFIFLIINLLRGKIVGRYKGSFLWKSDGSSVSLGYFRFVYKSSSEKYLEETHLHEYGHTIQSYILGITYLLIIGLPSIVWCNCFYNWRKEHKKSYYWFYTESWANRLVGLKK